MFSSYFNADSHSNTFVSDAFAYPSPVGIVGRPRAVWSVGERSESLWDNGLELFFFIGRLRNNGSPTGCR